MISELANGERLILMNTNEDTKDPDDGFVKGRWWRITLDDGRLWMETSDSEEIRYEVGRLDVEGTKYTVERLYEKIEKEWRKVDVYVY